MLKVLFTTFAFFEEKSLNGYTVNHLLGKTKSLVGKKITKKITEWYTNISEWHRKITGW